MCFIPLLELILFFWCSFKEWLSYGPPWPTPRPKRPKCQAEFLQLNAAPDGTNAILVEFCWGNIRQCDSVIGPSIMQNDVLVCSRYSLIWFVSFVSRKTSCCKPIAANCSWDLVGVPGILIDSKPSKSGFGARAWSQGALKVPNFPPTSWDLGVGLWQSSSAHPAKHPTGSIWMLFSTWALGVVHRLFL
jgi:hypothetical protein